MNICSPSLSQVFPLQPPLISFQLTPFDPAGVYGPWVLPSFLLSLTVPSLLHFHGPSLEWSLPYIFDGTATLIMPVLILKKPQPGLSQSQPALLPSLHLHSSIWLEKKQCWLFSLEFRDHTHLKCIFHVARQSYYTPPAHSLSRVTI